MRSGIVGRGYLLDLNLHSGMFGQAQGRQGRRRV